jgi:hypothetical protein
VYHGHDSPPPCNTGVETEVAELPVRASPCPVCQAPAMGDMYEDDLVDLEEDRHAVDVCRDPGEVLALLQDPRATGRSAVDRLSSPAQRLLNRAAPYDTGIAEVVEREHWL